jgi:hypothetical protein
MQILCHIYMKITQVTLLTSEALVRLSQEFAVCSALAITDDPAVQ